MIVDSNIANAIESYLKENNKTAKELCRMIGISEPAIIKWRRPGKGILQRHWMVLYPYIKKYLPPERIYRDENGEEQYSSALEGSVGTRPYFKPKYIPQMVPIITMKQLEKFNYVMDSIEQYAAKLKSNLVEYYPKTQSAFGVFCIKANGIGEIPDGATVFVSSQLRPKNGSMVFFIECGNNEIKYGKFTTLEDKYFLSHEYGELEGEISEMRNRISIMFPVLYYEVVTF